MIVERSQLDRSMQRRSGCPSYEKRGHEAARTHLPAQLLHLEEGWGYEPAHANHVGSELGRLAKNLLLRHHDAQVRHVEPVATQHYSCNILTYVVDIALDRGDEKFRLGAGAVLRVRLHERREHVYRLPHQLRRLDHLRQEHAPRSEIVPDGLHPVHQRPFDHCHGAAQHLKALQHIVPQRRSIACHKRSRQPRRSRYRRRTRRNRARTRARNRARTRRTRRALQHLPGLGNQPFGRIVAPVENHILDLFEHIRLYITVNLKHPGVDYAHIQPCPDRMVEEGRMHRFPHRVVAAEGEGEVGYAPGRARPRQIPFDPAHRLDEVHPVAAVLLNARTHREHVDIEYDVARQHSGLPGEQAVGPLAYLDFPRVVRSLALLVEGHHYHSRAQAPYFPGLHQEDLLALLEGYGVDYALALRVLQALQHRLPIRRIHHKRGLRHGRV